jgi:hypothetical protein
MRRNRTVVILAVALVLALAAGAAVSYYFARLAQQQAEAARQAEQRADAAAEAARLAEKQAKEQARRAEQALYASQLAQAQRAFDDRDLQRVSELLEQCQQDLRGWEHHHLWSRFHSKPPAPEPDKKVPGVAFSPDGQRIAIGDDPPRP